jgi:hypothetical protein
MVRSNSGLETLSEDTSLNIKALMTGTNKPSFHHSIRTILCGAIMFTAWNGQQPFNLAVFCYIRRSRVKKKYPTEVWCESVNND